ncbi:hypothetical protein HanRHA438_Chr10g0480111 [Helianthus annuus]|nr:hypothetical protein HanRHA438_Chr10g0480111 [Helianthus annuus]
MAVRHQLLSTLSRVPQYHPDPSGFFHHLTLLNTRIHTPVTKHHFTTYSLRLEGTG